MASTSSCLPLGGVILLLLLVGGAPAQDDDDVQCSGVFLWSCVKRDLARDLAAIISEDTFNVSRFVSVERVRQGPAVEGRLRRMAHALEDADGADGPALVATAIRLFKTHALVWRLWPGQVHLKVWNHDGEGMDAAVEIPASTDGRTWGAIAARRRITMALLPIMYKMGVGTTLLGVLVFLAMKTVFMVSILFVLAISSFAKHKLSALGGHHGAVYIPAPLPAPHPGKEVHVHVHTDPHKQAYGGWHREGPSHHYHSGFPPDYHADYRPVYHSGYHSDYQHSYDTEESPGHGHGPAAYYEHSAPYYHRAPSASGLGYYSSSR